MILEDFVFLGTTVPEQMKDGRVVRCAAGFSDELRSLARLYPLSPFAGIRRWDQYRVRVERSNKDSRIESFKLAGDRDDPDALTRELVVAGRLGEHPKSTRLAAIDRYKVPSIKWMNERRLSLGIINPDLCDFSFEYDLEADRLITQLPGLETPKPEWGRKSYPKRPRIQFRDEDGFHDLSFNEHGVYEWLRKGNEPEEVFKNLRFGDTTREPRLLVGNLANQRNAWVVITYFSYARQQAALFPETDVP
jgi:hypothetical protein